MGVLPIQTWVRDAVWRPNKQGQRVSNAYFMNPVLSSQPGPGAHEGRALAAAERRVRSSGTRWLSSSASSVSKLCSLLGLRRCNSHCYELEGSTSCREERKFRKLCSTRAARYGRPNQARTHYLSFLANHSGTLVEPAVTRRAGTCVMYLWLVQGPPAVSARGCLSHDLQCEVLSHSPPMHTVHSGHLRCGCLRRGVS